ncbi:TadE/TadG family type IV pilus assembly protein [Nocardioides convexus]|uniref:TadE/TadG family type IV pilus assembly protein n=1 Tax=Nocardioides convexus TaxID=2712224 RepID=UPI00310143E0
MVRRVATRWRAQRGAAAVGFALIMPLLLILVFGIIAYGYMLELPPGDQPGRRRGRPCRRGEPADLEPGHRRDPRDERRPRLLRRLVRQQRHADPQGHERRHLHRRRRHLHR